MNKILLLLAVITFNTTASKNDDMVDSIIQYGKSSGNFNKLARCLDMPEDKVIKIYRKEVAHCFRVC